MFFVGWWILSLREQVPAIFLSQFLIGNTSLKKLGTLSATLYLFSTINAHRHSTQQLTPKPNLWNPDTITTFKVKPLRELESCPLLISMSAHVAQFAFLAFYEHHSLLRPWRASRKRRYMFEFDITVALMVYIRWDLLKVSPCLYFSGELTTNFQNILNWIN